MLYPIGIQHFPTLIKDGFVYIDKTKLIAHMIRSGQNYFLARPRRFGKSLLVSTLESLFKGEKELFDGLWITSSDYNWETCPVISLDFSLLITDSFKEFTRTLQTQFQHIANQYNLGEIRMESPSETLVELVIKLSSLGRVVILIDEYDKPILDNLGASELLDQYRKLFKTFYANIKALGKYLRFTLITGVTKITQISLFSGMNNPIDLSFNPFYAGLLGITEDEIEKYFLDEIKEIAFENQHTIEEEKTRIKTWYNGYRFSGKLNTPSVYNPISLMNYLSSHRLTNYWFATGTPTFAYKIIKEQNFVIPDFESDVYAGNAIESSHDIENIDLITLLYQTGYLTIKSFDEQTQNYTLQFPNEEIRRSFFEHLFHYFSQLKPFQIAKFIAAIQKSLLEHHFEEFFASCNELFSSIPYVIQIAKEAYYHSLIYLLVKLLGFNVDAEVMTGSGRIDLIVKQPKDILVFEFKFDSSAKAALEQMKELNYYSPYLNTGKRIRLIGANFKGDTRSVNEWVSEVL